MCSDHREPLSLPAAAKLLGVSWAQAWRLILMGTLRAELVGGRWRVDAGDVARVVAARTGGASKDGVR